MEYFEGLESVFIVYECTCCYAVIPYPGTPHNCPDGDDEGFNEFSYYMELFVNWFKKNECSCYLVRAPDLD